MSRIVGVRVSSRSRFSGSGPAWVGALCLAAQSACSGPEQDESAGDGFHELDRSAIRDTLEGADPVRNLSVSRNGNRAEHLVRFNSLGRDFTLHLAPNGELFAKDMVVVRDGVALTPDAAGLEPPLKGLVEGDPRSWVRARLRDGAFEGLVFTEHELFEIRPTQENWLDLRMARVEFSDYIENPSGNEAHCGVVDDPTLLGTPAPEADDTLEQQGCTWIGIHVIADYTYAGKTGGASGAEAEMATRMNEIDGLYRSDMNYGFRVEQVTSHSSSGGPAYNATGLSPNAQLTALRDWKSQNDRERGLVHLFAGRVTSGTVGVAYVGGICQSATGSGVSNYLGTSRSSTICPAHEIGHNFGAQHDSSGAPYVMAPSVNRSATSFSDQSKSQINSTVRSRDCFTPCGAAGTGGTGGSGGSGTGGSGGGTGTGGTGGGTGTGGTGTGGTGGTGTGGTGGGTGTGGTGGTGTGGTGTGGTGTGGTGTGGTGTGGTGTGGTGTGGGDPAGGAGGAGPLGAGGEGGLVGAAGGPSAGGSVSAGTGAGAVAGVAGSPENSPATEGPRLGLTNDGACTCRTVETRNGQPLGLLLSLGLLGVLYRRRAKLKD